MADATASLNEGGSFRAPDPGRLVVERELGARLLALMACAAAAAVAVAYSLDVSARGPATLGDAVVRRFDLTVLWVTALLAGTRIALNVELDERAEWLDSFIAAGGRRWRYIAGLGIAAFTGATLVFLAGAAAFALAVLWGHGSRELVRLLPHTAGMGLLVLAHWCAWFMLVAAITRRALPAVAIGVAVAAAPTVLMFIQLQRTEMVGAGVLRAMLLLPPVIWGGSTDALLTQFAAITLMAALALAGARRLVGRHR